MYVLDAGPARLFIFKSQCGPLAKKFAQPCSKPEQFILQSSKDLHATVFLGLCTANIGTCRKTLDELLENCHYRWLK